MIRSAPYLHDPTRYFAQLANGGWSISWHRSMLGPIRTHIYNVVSVMTYSPSWEIQGRCASYKRCTLQMLFPLANNIASSNPQSDPCPWLQHGGWVNQKDEIISFYTSARKRHKLAGHLIEAVMLNTYLVQKKNGRSLSHFNCHLNAGMMLIDASIAGPRHQTSWTNRLSKPHSSSSQEGNTAEAM